MVTLHFDQTKSGLTANYVGYIGDEVRYRAEIPFNYIGYEARLFRYDREWYRVRFDWKGRLENMVRTGKNKELVPFSINDATGELRGHLARRRSKAFMGYFYFEFFLNGVVYTIYEVGCGKEGLKLPVYAGTRQIALIEKDIVTYDNKDTYAITARDEYSAEVALLFNLYFDFVRYGRHGEVSVKSKKTALVYTTNKELKAKYRPDWADL